MRIALTLFFVTVAAAAPTNIKVRTSGEAGRHVEQDEQGRVILVEGNRRTILGATPDKSSESVVDAIYPTRNPAIDPRVDEMYKMMQEGKITEDQFWNANRRLRDRNAIRHDVVKDIITGQNQMHLPFINGGREIPLQPTRLNTNFLDPDSNHFHGTYGQTEDATAWATRLFAPIPGHAGYLGSPNRRTGLYFNESPRVYNPRVGFSPTGDQVEDEFMLGSLGAFTG